MIRALRGLAAGAALLAAGCATLPPGDQGNLCSVFEQYPDWFDYARASEREWGHAGAGPDGLRAP